MTTIRGSGGSDLIFGTTGADEISGGGGDDQIFSGDGDDDVDGGSGNDTIHTGDGNDEASGGSGNDAINGGEGDDTIDGDGGNDQIFGENGADVLNGSGGDDFIYGGGGVDTLSGGGGVDTFFFGLATDSNLAGADKIKDFDHLVDQIDFNHLVAAGAVVNDSIGPITTVATLGFFGAAKVVVEHAGGAARVFGDVNGNGSLDAGDLVIDLTKDPGNLTATDFIF